MDRHDDLDPARGIIFGLIISLIIWGAVLVMMVW